MIEIAADEQEFISHRHSRGYLGPLATSRQPAKSERINGQIFPFPQASPAKKHHPKPGGGKSGSGKSGSGAAATPQPVFAQPMPSPDPTGFKQPVTDQSEKEIANLEPVPQPKGGAVEPVLTFAQIYGSGGAAKSAAIQKSGQIVFHAVGDTGSVEGPMTQSLVADKMVSDFTEANPADEPSFFYHLGDVVYYFGEAAYYYDQFYEPYRSYPAPILGIPGNHDGVVYASDPAPTLAAFLANFCAAEPVVTPDAGGLVRTAMIQPGVYYTFDAPFVRILGLYSNVLEDPGVISDEGGMNTVLDSRQVDFLTAALKRVKSEKYAGAVIIAVHHPPFSGDTTHGGSRPCLKISTARAWPPESGRTRSSPATCITTSASHAR